jgi:hypothetical protein
MADRFEALPSAAKNLEMPDDLARKFVMNAFVDLKVYREPWFRGAA